MQSIYVLDYPTTALYPFFSVKPIKPQNSTPKVVHVLTIIKYSQLMRNKFCYDYLWLSYMYIKENKSADMWRI